ncbi:6-phosphogluconate dehydrogenase [Streptomyces agglomeratus]|uniref:6-phosphogluconate dehydrogenase n=1 Tax=Streptomyces agglomeratus TaxID=285458 RepID=A0A1E5P804_9ACTN|nr:NAD(P)-binding domain-containing protein [Streptomyces agglomeratus]OEJ25673.1 6-phosphogluconate dehydrogenase [Streptomyces agglomeratus]OEJ52838.1 6-phosphogluconate dehydrogenase [Streptomyces agglomeratus]
MSKPFPASPVSVLGLGMMGSALAAALLDAGHPVTVWNRSAAKTGPLVAQGATPAETVTDAVAASPLVIVCFTTNDNVGETLAAVDLTGKTLVNLTNGTPAQARALALRARKQGASYLDGGIMAVPQMIATPGAYVLYSGDEQAYETHRPTLAALGGTQWVGTDPGRAALHDIALLTGMYGMFIGVAQAFALVRTENITAAEFAEPLHAWVSAMLGGVVPGVAAAVDSGQHLTDVSSLGINQAAFSNFIETYDDQGVSPELFVPFQKLLDRSVAEGHAADGLSRLVDLLKK